MVRRPYPSDALVDTPDRLVRFHEPLAARIPQQLSLLKNLQRLQLPHADRLLSPINVVSDYYWVFSRSRRYCDFDFGVRFGEVAKVTLDEAPREEC